VADAGYMPQIPDRAESEEVHTLCPLLDLAGSCGVQEMTYGGPYQDRGNSEFGGPKKCQTIACNAQAYRIL